MRDADQIKDIIPRVIENLSSGEIQNQNKIQQAWTGIIGAKAQKHTAIVGIKANMLLVNVDSPAWLYQMKMRKKKFLNALKDQSSGITEISFRVGKV